MQLDKTSNLSSQIACKLLITSKKPRPASISEVNVMLLPPDGFASCAKFCNWLSLFLLPMLLLGVHFRASKESIAPACVRSIGADPVGVRGSEPPQKFGCGGPLWLGSPRKIQLNNFNISMYVYNRLTQSS
jgi:hypothetical protein